MPPSVESSPPAACAHERHLWTARCMLAVAVLVQLTLGYRWMGQNGFLARPPANDSAWYRMESWASARALADDGVAGWLAHGHRVRGAHPPLMMMLGGTTAHLLDRGEAGPRALWVATALVNVLLAVASYRLARAFVTPVRAALAAAAAVSTPGIICYTRPFDPHLAMAAFVVLSLDALVRSDLLRRPGWAAAAGFYLGIATQAKMLAPLYAGGAFTVAAVLGWRRSGWRSIRLGVTLAIVAGGVCLLYWYPTHLRGVLRYTHSVTSAEGQAIWSSSMPRWSVERWLYYPRAIVNTSLALPLSALVLAAVIGLALRAIARRRATGTRRFAGAGWVVAGSAIIAFPPLVIGQASSNNLYTLSMLPLATLAVAHWIEGFSSSRARRMLDVALIAAAAWGSIVAYRAFPDDVARGRWCGFWAIGKYDDRITNPARQSGVAASPAGEAWPLGDFAAAMVRRIPDRNPALANVVSWTHPYLIAPNLEYAAALLGRTLRIVNFARAGRRLEGRDLAELASADFVVVTPRALQRGRVRLPLESLLAEMRAAGLDVEVVAEAQPTPRSPLALVWIKPPGARGAAR
jgi:hypothetical protein